MSRVTNVILCALEDDDERTPCAQELSGFMAKEWRGGLARVDRHAISSKWPEMEIWIAGVNYMDRQRLIEKFHSIDWGPCGATLITLGQDDDVWEIEYDKPLEGA